MITGKLSWQEEKRKIIHALLDNIGPAGFVVEDLFGGGGIDFIRVWQNQGKYWYHLADVWGVVERSCPRDELETLLYLMPIGSLRAAGAGMQKEEQ